MSYAPETKEPKRFGLLLRRFSTSLKSSWTNRNRRVARQQNALSGTTGHDAQRRHGGELPASNKTQTWPLKQREYIPPNYVRIDNGLNAPIYTSRASPFAGQKDRPRQSPLTAKSAPKKQMGPSPLIAPVPAPSPVGPRDNTWPHSIPVNPGTNAKPHGSPAPQLPRAKSRQGGELPASNQTQTWRSKQREHIPPNYVRIDNGASAPYYTSRASPFTGQKDRPRQSPLIAPVPALSSPLIAPVPAPSPPLIAPVPALSSPLIAPVPAPSPPLITPVPAPSPVGPRDNTRLHSIRVNPGTNAKPHDSPAPQLPRAQGTSIEVNPIFITAAIRTTVMRLTADFADKGGFCVGSPQERHNTPQRNAIRARSRFEKETGFCDPYILRWD